MLSSIWPENATMAEELRMTGIAELWIRYCRNFIASKFILSYFYISLTYTYTPMYHLLYIHTFICIYEILSYSYVCMYVCLFPCNSSIVISTIFQGVTYRKTLLFRWYFDGLLLPKRARAWSICGIHKKLTLNHWTECFRYERKCGHHQRSAWNEPLVFVAPTNTGNLLYRLLQFFLSIFLTYYLNALFLYLSTCRIHYIFRVFIFTWQPYLGPCGMYIDIDYIFFLTSNIISIGFVYPVSTSKFLERIKLILNKHRTKNGRDISLIFK